MNISIILRTELSFQKFIKSTKVMNYIIIRFTHQYMTLQSQNKMKVKYIFWLYFTYSCLLLKIIWQQIRLC